MLNLSKLLRRVTAIALLVGGCHGLPLVAPGATEVTYPSFERSDCGLNLNRSFPGGTLLIDSEESFHAHFACRGSSDLVVVFLADGKSRAPKLVRTERKGDRLTAIFSVEPYCGGAPPFPTTAVHPFLVRRASLSLESKVVTLNRFKSCPKDLP